ncbi:MAG: DUF3160 domain-containing protein [Verrucomicrobia bacterium]|nr:DUF3160 domain-containing protein [Verrucomicrobiota bacterium]
MKSIIFPILPLLGCLTPLGAVPLPDAALQPFAPVPAGISGPTAPAKPMEEKPPGLPFAKNLDRLLKEKLRARISPEARAFLAENRFVLLDPEGTPIADHQWSDEMLEMFDRMAGSETEDLSWHPRMVTADVFLHAYHRYFSNALEVIETRELRPRLDAFLTAMLRNAAELRPQTDGATAKRLEWVEAQLAAAWVVLGCEKSAPKPKNPDDSDHSDEADEDDPRPKCDPRLLDKRLADIRKRFTPEVAGRLAAEVALVRKAAETENSPLFACYDPSKPTDYSQFTPRSHYTKSEELRGYFRAMMFLGLRGPILLEKDSPGITDALLIAQIMARKPADGPRPLDLWRPLMEITTFFAGPSDDLDYPAFQRWIATTLGSADVKLSSATDRAVVSKLSAALGKLPKPAIVSGPNNTMVSPESDPPSFRIFGQRFSADAWILSALTRGSPVEAPSLPSGLFVTAAFGDPFSMPVALEIVAENHQELFGRRMEACRGELGGKPDAFWFGSMAAAQLHAATRLCGHRDDNYPYFMRTRAFAAKTTETVLGSWAELKHDTVLYAKQAYAEMGEGGDPDQPPKPPMTRTFVQPDVAFWRAMERLVAFTDAGMAKHQLLPDAGEEYSRLGRFLKDVRLCRAVAEKEIAGNDPDAREWEELRSMRLSYMDEPMGENVTADDERWKAALVTDVFTDGVTGKILHEGLSRPCLMVALVNDKHGTRAVTGPVYRHHEFTRPLGERMTDEAWKEQVYGEKASLPARAGWAAPVFAVEPVKSAN